MRGPSKGYIEAIESRLHKLESFLGESIQKDDPRAKTLLDELSSPLETATGEQIRTRPVRRKRQNKRTSHNKTERENEASEPPTHHQSTQRTPLHSTSFNHVSSPTGFQESSNSQASVQDSSGLLTIDANGRVRYLGNSSGYYIVQESRTCQNTLPKDLVEKLVSTNKTQPTTDFDPFEMPPKDLSDHLIETYFQYCYPCLPIFNRKVLVSPADSLEPVSPLLLNAIYAVASCMSQDKRVRTYTALSETAGDVFIKRAIYMVDRSYDLPKISTVQAMLLLSVYQQGKAKAPRAWMYSGIAFRMAQDLGLNRNCEHLNITKDEKELRLRVFWCCFVVDRTISAQYGRPLNLEERDIDIPFPQEDDEIIPLGNSTRPPIRLIESFIFQIRICDILGNILKNIYGGTQHHRLNQYNDRVLLTLEQQIAEWHNSLPPSLQYTPQSENYGEIASGVSMPVCQLHMLYSTAIILLHRPFIPTPTHTENTIALPSYKCCVSSAERIISIIETMKADNNLPFVPNYTTYHMFTACIVFINIASSNTPELATEAKINIKKIMRALDQIDMTWKHASRICDILGEFAVLRNVDIDIKDIFQQDKATSLPPLSLSVSDSQEESFHYSHDKKTSDSFEKKTEQTQFVNERWANEYTDSEIETRMLHDTVAVSAPESQATSYAPIDLEYKCSHIVQSDSTPIVKSNIPEQPILNIIEQTIGQEGCDFLDNQASDPFAAPGTVIATSPRYFDSSGAMLWSTPSSTNYDEWSQYLGTHNLPGHQYNDTNAVNTSMNSNHYYTRNINTFHSILSQHTIPLVNRSLILSHDFFPTQQFRNQFPQNSSIPRQQDNHFQRQFDSSKDTPHASHDMGVYSGIVMPLIPESSRHPSPGFNTNKPESVDTRERQMPLNIPVNNYSNNCEAAELVYW
ncbi:fungal-specific transcription factor domain-containing protein [Spinellus fusiger]|nr:fungal-specific transcription factor domain-containing protein [Spinellus fusiger]